ncbi:hypothetical protein D3C75_1022020 [compost metagenome]
MLADKLKRGLARQPSHRSRRLQPLQAIGIITLVQLPFNTPPQMLYLAQPHHFWWQHIDRSGTALQTLADIIDHQQVFLLVLAVLQ